jgi:hypothetical protein
MTGGSSKPAPSRPATPASPPPRPATPRPPTRSELPRLGEVIRDTERYLAQALATLGREYDPASAPDEDDGPSVRPGDVMVRLMAARADVHSALDMLAQVVAFGLPPVGSAIPVPGPPLTVYASDEGGGPFDHQPPGEAGRPAPAAASRVAAGESEGVPAPAQAIARPAGPPPCRPGANQHTDGSFSLPVWPGTARLVRLINESVAHGRRP